MKKLFAIFCLTLLATNLYSQTEFKIYSWKELPQNFNADTIFGLSLKKLKLAQVPSELSQFKNLKHLDLSHNKLEKLPDFIYTLQNLEELNLGKNKFQVLDTAVSQLHSLKKLILNRNQLETLPTSIYYLINLKTIDLWDNPIINLPEELTQLKNLKELHLEGIVFGPKFQEKWITLLPNTVIFFEKPCACKE